MCVTNVQVKWVLFHSYCLLSNINSNTAVLIPAENQLSLLNCPVFLSFGFGVWCCCPKPCLHKKLYSSPKTCKSSAKICRKASLRKSFCFLFLNTFNLACFIPNRKMKHRKMLPNSVTLYPVFSSWLFQNPSAKSFLQRLPVPAFPQSAKQVFIVCYLPVPTVHTVYFHAALIRSVFEIFAPPDSKPFRFHDLKFNQMLVCRHRQQH